MKDKLKILYKSKKTNKQTKTKHYEIVKNAVLTNMGQERQVPHVGLRRL